MRIIEGVLRDSVQDTDLQLRNEIVTYCIGEICKSEANNFNSSNDLPKLSSDMIVHIGKMYHNEVMDFLFDKFQPGTQPHFYVVKTLANLSVENPFGLVPYLKALLGTMLPMLAHTKSDNSKWIYAYCLARFAEGRLKTF